MKCPCKLPLVLLVLEIVSVCRGVDKTLEAGASGCEVAKAAIDKVVASNIFKKTENFVLVRLALVSAFGTSDSFIPGGTGIWQLTEQNLNDSQVILNHLNLAQSIEEILCINFTTAEKEDLKMPLYSAVCAMLLIQGQSSSIMYVETRLPVSVQSPECYNTPFNLSQFVLMKEILGKLYFLNFFFDF